MPQTKHLLLFLDLSHIVPSSLRPQHHAPRPLSPCTTLLQFASATYSERQAPLSRDKSSTWRLRSSPRRSGWDTVSSSQLWGTLPRDTAIMTPFFFPQGISSQTRDLVWLLLTLSESCSHPWLPSFYLVPAFKFHIFKTVRKVQERLPCQLVSYYRPALLLLLIHCSFWQNRGPL